MLTMDPLYYELRTPTVPFWGIDNRYDIYIYQLVKGHARCASSATTLQNSRGRIPCVMLCEDFSDLTGLGELGSAVNLGDAKEVK